MGLERGFANHEVSERGLTTHEVIERVDYSRG